MGVPVRVWGALVALTLLGVMWARAEVTSPPAKPSESAVAQTAVPPDLPPTPSKDPENAASKGAPAKPLDDSSLEPPADGPKVLFPLQETILLSGRFDVICKAKPGARLTVDGREQSWEPFQPPVFAARVGLSPGIHEIGVNDKVLEICVALNEEEHDAPSDWQFAYKHALMSGEKRCDKCHQASHQKGVTTVGKWKGYKACLECHSPIEFEATHAHPLEPLEPCQMCHAVHGAKRKGLLKAPIKQLCKDCHDS